MDCGLGRDRALDCDAYKSHQERQGFKAIGPPRSSRPPKFWEGPQWTPRPIRFARGRLQAPFVSAEERGSGDRLRIALSIDEPEFASRRGAVNDPYMQQVA